jgi:hypothetical protein
MTDFNEDPIIITLLTQAMREADLKFETVGGGTRHYVRDCLLPEIEKVGLSISKPQH